MNKVFIPEEILPSGEDYTMAVNPFTGNSGKVRKGIVVATLNNIALLNQLLPQSTEIDQINSIKKAIIELLPSLKVVGIFDLFNLEEWISDSRQLGRIYIVVLYLKQYPEEMTRQLALKLKKVKQKLTSVSLHRELDEIYL